MRNNPPVRLRVVCKDGTRRTYYTGYGAIKKHHEAGTLVAAYSTSTGKKLIVRKVNK